MYPEVQVALDFLNLKRAMKVAEKAVKGGAEWLEAGTPLIKSEGLNVVRELKKRFPDKTIIADMKIMDVGRIETEAAAKAGADVVCVLAAASDSTIKECVFAGRNYGVKIEADLIEIKAENIAERAKQVENMGVNLIGVHCAIDEQMQVGGPFEKLKLACNAVDIPVSVAGGINSETAAETVKAGAKIVVVGGAINKAKNPEESTSTILKAVRQKESITTDLFKRGGADKTFEIFSKVSTANISDALHRKGVLQGIYPLVKDIKMVGKALTVRTYPGDWAKSVEAIDRAETGDVLVIDAGGVGPAVWGELATHGALQKKIAGIVVNGAVRDSSEIRELKFPAFSKLITPAAGEPKGFGEIGVGVSVGSEKVFSGDWIVGDNDGVVCIPQDKVIEISNRAMSVLEYENRLREEIEEGSTLGKVIELLKWEKK